MVLERKTEPKPVDDDIEVLMWDPDQKIVTLRITREALEDYYDSRGISLSSLHEMLLGPAYPSVMETVDKIYDRHPRPKPSRIVVTTKDLNR